MIENLPNGLPGIGLNQVIQINTLPSHAICQKATDGGFASAAISSQVKMHALVHPVILIRVANDGETDSAPSMEEDRLSS